MIHIKAPDIYINVWYKRR